jgi:hypothetical protein
LAFLSANWYSGATLFNILLNNHKLITSNGEGFPFRVSDDTQYTCSCGRTLEQCDFYRHAAGHMYDSRSNSWDRTQFAQLPRYSDIGPVNKWIQSYRYARRARDAVVRVVPAFRRAQDRFLAAHDAFFRNATSLKGAAIYLDGTKSFRRAELFASRTEALIYLVRDGRGYCNSYRKNRQLDGGQLDQAARSWLSHLDSLRVFGLRYPNVRIHVVRYEDLCRDLDSTMRTICVFLGLPFDEGVLGRSGLAEYHLLGNRMRMTFDGTVNEDLSWQTELTEAQIGIVTDITRTKLSEFGYV